MRAILVFGPIGCVAEGLVAIGIVARVRFFSSMRPNVSLQVLQAAVCLLAGCVLNTSRITVWKSTTLVTAYGASMGFLSRVLADVHHQHVLSLKRSPFSLAIGPITNKVALLLLLLNVLLHMLKAQHYCCCCISISHECIIN